MVLQATAKGVRVAICCERMVLLQLPDGPGEVVPVVPFAPCHPDDEALDLVLSPATRAVERELADPQRIDESRNYAAGGSNEVVKPVGLVHAWIPIDLISERLVDARRGLFAP